MLGKLAARLVPVLGLVGCALPVMAMLTLLGGVDPDALIGAFLMTVGVALIGCSLALVFSLWVGKTHEALMGTYAVFGLWLLARPMLTTLGGALGVSLPIPDRMIDPFYLAFAPYWYPGVVGWWDYVAFLGVMAGLSMALAMVAVWRLRPVCTREKGPARKRGWGWLGRHLPTFARSRRFLVAWLAPSLDFNPVLWREWHRNRSSRMSRIVVGLYGVLAVTFSGIAIVSGAWMLGLFVNGLQVSIGLLLLSVTASTSLAEERVRGSLDVLMSTSLPTRQIVIGKWLGTFRLVPLLTILPCLVILSFMFWNPSGMPRIRPIVDAVLLVGYILACGAMVTSFGLAMATWCSRLGRAVGLTITAYVVMTVGWMFTVIALMAPQPTGLFLIMASPFYGAVGLTIHAVEKRMHEPLLPGVIFWTLVYGISALVLLIITLATFNRCLGRVENGLFEMEGTRRMPVILVRVNEEYVEQAL